MRECVRTGRRKGGPLVGMNITRLDPALLRPLFFPRCCSSSDVHWCGTAEIRWRSDHPAQTAPHRSADRVVGMKAGRCGGVKGLWRRAGVWPMNGAGTSISKARRADESSHLDEGGDEAEGQSIAEQRHPDPRARPHSSPLSARAPVSHNLPVPRCSLICPVSRPA